MVLVRVVDTDFAEEIKGGHLEGVRPLGEADSIAEQVEDGLNLGAVAETEERVPPCSWVLLDDESTSHNVRRIWEELLAITQAVDR